MDFLQLVDDDVVNVYALRKGFSDTVLYDEAAVREKYGFGPERLVDYKAFVAIHRITSRAYLALAKRPQKR